LTASVYLSWSKLEKNLASINKDAIERKNKLTENELSAGFFFNDLIAGLQFPRFPKSMHSEMLLA